MGYISRLVILCVSILVGNTGAFTQIPAPPQDRPIALTGATIHTVSNGTISNGTILFEEGKIVAIGTHVAIPHNAQIYELNGKHVYPGLIDSYTNMGLTEIGAVEVTSDFNEYGRMNPNVRAEVAFHPESEHIPVGRSHGVTIAISSPSGGIISGTSAAMMMDGWTWEQMTLRAPVGMMVTWPQLDGETENARNELQELREAFRNARAYKQARLSAIDHGKDLRWEAMIPVFQQEIPVVVQANTTQQIQDAITWAEEERIRIVILGGRDAHFVTEQLVTKNVPVILSPILTSPTRPWQGYDDMYTTASRLHNAGVRFAISGEYGSANAMRLRHHAATAAAFGLGREEALKAITLYPAKIFGISDRVGSLGEGKDATLIITDGDIFDLRSSVEQVFIQGRKIDMSDRHKNLFLKYTEKYRQLVRE